MSAECETSETQMETNFRLTAASDQIWIIAH